MRAALASSLLVLTACRDPDLGPLRADLRAAADAVCAPFPERPTYAAPTRVVEPADATQAILTVCTEVDPGGECAARPVNDACKMHLTAAAPAFATLHEATLQARPVSGAVRRNTMFTDTPFVDLTAPASSASKALLQVSAQPRCSASRYSVENAVALAVSADPEHGLARCLDIHALVRDRYLTGDMMDVLLAQSSAERAEEPCNQAIAASSADAAHAFAKDLRAIRLAIPATLEDVVKRDRAEMKLIQLGPLRDPAQTFSCDRARALATSMDGKVTLARKEKVALVASWRGMASTKVESKYATRHTETLRRIDQLVTTAEGR